MTKIIFLIFFVAGLARADIKPSLINEMQAARVKLDAKPAAKKVTKGEPDDDRYKEFAGLVDDSYEQLEAEKTQLLELKSDDPNLQTRVNSWVLTASLSLYLDPGFSASDLIDQVKRKLPSAFKAAESHLDQGLRLKLVKATAVYDAVKKRGNGG